MHEVFLSHASQDQGKARRLRKFLVAQGIPVWFSPHHLRGAQLWHDEIGEALARCGWFIVLMTPHAVKSMWVRRELRYALTETRYDGHIVPMLFKKSNARALSWALPQFQFIDFTKEYRRGCRELVRVLKGRR